MKLSYTVARSSLDNVQSDKDPVVAAVAPVLDSAIVNRTGSMHPSKRFSAGGTLQDPDERTQQNYSSAADEYSESGDFESDSEQQHQQQQHHHQQQQLHQHQQQQQYARKASAGYKQGIVQQHYEEPLTAASGSTYATLARSERELDRTAFSTVATAATAALPPPPAATTGTAKSAARSTNAAAAQTHAYAQGYAAAGSRADTRQHVQLSVQQNSHASHLLQRTAGGVLLDRSMEIRHEEPIHKVSCIHIESLYIPITHT